MKARDEGSIFPVMHPLYCPELNELIDRRIDVLYSFHLGCQVKVITTLIEKRKPTAVVHWDDA
jgi:hypothetical protein